ncbi:MAG: matrixin family metalloprotease, partial [Pseudomonadota bacterium]
ERRGEPGIIGLGVQNLDEADLISAITWQDAAVDTSDPVTVYFAGAGEFVNQEGLLLESLGFTQEERQLILGGLRTASTFADIEFTQTGDQDTADFQIARTDLSDLDSDLVGLANPIGSSFYSDGVILLDDDTYWTEPALRKGGLMNHIIVHEFGHALGLAHPHDYGGFSRPFPGVRESYEVGDFDLNQTPFTAMTYNEYWNGPIANEPQNEGSGYLWGFGTLDMIALQEIYGANEAYRSGGNDYLLGRNNWFEAIWDTGGVDKIRYTGTENVTIDLRPATGAYEDLGGGGVSYIEDGRSGFAIGKDVEIERAAGGRGKDTILGNALDNKLEGRNNGDEISGFDGSDTILGGNGNDLLLGNNGPDLIQGGKGKDEIFGGRGSDTLLGNRDDDFIDGGSNDDTIDGGLGNDTVIGGNGDDLLEGGGGADVFVFDDNDGTDTIIDFNEADFIDLSDTGLSFGEISIDVNGSTAQVQFGATTINFTNLAADLDSSDFILAS